MPKFIDRILATGAGVRPPRDGRGKYMPITVDRSGRVSRGKIVLCLGVLSLVLAGAGLSPGVGAAPAGTVPFPPVYLVDSEFAPTLATRIYAVDIPAGIMTLKAELGTTYTP